MLVLQKSNMPKNARRPAGELVRRAKPALSCTGERAGFFWAPIHRPRTPGNRAGPIGSKEAAMTEQQETLGSETTTADAGQAALDQIEKQGRDDIAAVLKMVQAHESGQPIVEDAPPAPDAPGSKEAKPAPKPTPEGTTAADEPKPYAPTDRQRKAAEQLGYETEDMADLKERDFIRLERQWANTRKLEQKLGTVTDQLNKLAKAKQPTPKPKDTEDELEDDLLDEDKTGEDGKDEEVGDLDLDELAISPSDNGATVARKSAAQVKLLKDMQAQLAEDRQERQERQEREQRDAQAQTEQETDEWFGNLDPADWSDDQGKPIFGEGKTAGMDGRSVEARFRKAVMAKAAALIGADPDMDTAQALDTALLLLHKDKYLTAAQRRKAAPTRKKEPTAGATPRAAPPTTRSDEQVRHAEAAELAAALAGAGVSMRVGTG